MTRLVLLLVLGVLAVATLRWSMLLRGADRRRLLAGTVLTALLTAGTWSVTGHPSVGGGRPVAVAADALHLTAAALWVGGLLLLLVAGGAPLRAALTFSRMALPCVLVIAVTGVYQAQRELPAWSALVGTDYGRLVLGKVAGLLLLAGCGQLARRVLARDADAVAAPARLRGLVALEVVVAAAVLGVAAVLVQTPPR
jgi:copper transport protein